MATPLTTWRLGVVPWFNFSCLCPNYCVHHKAFSLKGQIIMWTVSHISRIEYQLQNNTGRRWSTKSPIQVLPVILMQFGASIRGKMLKWKRELDTNEKRDRKPRRPLLISSFIHLTFIPPAIEITFYLLAFFPQRLHKLKVWHKLPDCLL